jgi:hypothetical protein
MIDMTKKKQRDLEMGKEMLFGDGGIMAQTSRQRVRKSTQTPYEALYTQGPSAHTLLMGDQVQHHGASAVQHKLDHHRREKVDTVINPNIIDLMVSANKKLGKRAISDLRENIRQSGEYLGIFVKQSNNRGQLNKTITGNELKTAVDSSYAAGQSIKIANYKRAQNTYVSATQNAVAVEDFVGLSKTNQGRRGQLLNDMYNMNVVDFDNEQGTGHEVQAARMVGGLGSKYMTEHVMDQNYSADTYGRGCGDVASTCKRGERATAGRVSPLTIR